MQNSHSCRYGPRYGVARVLSKRGLCSRSIAAQWVREGRVRVNGRRVDDPEFPCQPEHDRIEVDEQTVRDVGSVHVMLNKPRGLLTTRSDEQGRDTVYSCFAGSELPWLAPVGRLDKPSEGLLLFSNDPEWAAALLAPESGVHKTYHVQIDRRCDDGLLNSLLRGVDAGGERLGCVAAHMLREGEKSAWLEIVLDEGRNRQIRRMLEAHGVGVRRLVRVAIGDLRLGELGRGQWRTLTVAEVLGLSALAGYKSPSR